MLEVQILICVNLYKEFFGCERRNQRRYVFIKVIEISINYSCKEILNQSEQLITNNNK